MRIVAIDPGETTGCAVFGWDPADPDIGPVLLSKGEIKFSPFPGAATRWLYTQWVKITERDQNSVLVVENYRVYPSAAEGHFGKTIPTAELIGALKGAAELFIPPVKIALVEPSEKHRWAPARRKAIGLPTGWFEGGPHVEDAVMLALTWLEKEGSWTPVPPCESK